jgi:hypothetical protein
MIDYQPLPFKLNDIYYIMLYRLPLDHYGLKDKIVFVKSKNTLACKEHGDMAVVTVVEKDGKKYYWYRCLICHIAAAYDGNPETNQSWVSVVP